VVGVDNSDSSRCALRWVAQQAELTGSSLEAVTAWEWSLSVGRGMPLTLAYDPSTDAATILDRAIHDVVRIHPGLVIRPKVVEGHLMPALIEASEDADLVVVGAGVHRGIPGIVGGRLNAHCLARAHSPVVIVREDPHAPKSSARGGPTSAASSRSTVGTRV
jgi:nucleotide-binding universal stress UspA family protein